MHKLKTEPFRTPGWFINSNVFLFLKGNSDAYTETVLWDGSPVGQYVKNFKLRGCKRQVEYDKQLLLLLTKDGHSYDHVFGLEDEDDNLFDEDEEWLDDEEDEE